MLLQPDGVADAMLRALGLDGAIQLWLGDPSVALGTVFFVLGIMQHFWYRSDKRRERRYLSEDGIGRRQI